SSDFRRRSWLRRKNWSEASASCAPCSQLSPRTKPERAFSHGRARLDTAHPSRSRMGSMSEARAPSSQASSSAALCPACGKSVDPLRAGEVAILEGRFSYFCDRECKRSFLSGRSSGLQDATAEPPPVRSGERAVPQESATFPPNPRLDLA